MALGNKGGTAVKKAGEEGKELKLEILNDAFTSNEDVKKVLLVPDSLLERFTVVKEQFEKQSDRKLTRNAFARLALALYMERNDLVGGGGLAEIDGKKVIFTILASQFREFQLKQFKVVERGETPLTFSETLRMALDDLLTRIGA